MIYLCSVCKKESDKHPYKLEDTIFCSDCDPKYKCIVCGKPRQRPIGHSEFCEEHFKDNQRQKRQVNRGGGIMVIDNFKVEGTGMNRASYKQLNSRVLGDNGETLSGDKGIQYMKERAKDNPGYSARLKDYSR